MTRKDPSVIDVRRFASFLGTLRHVVPVGDRSRGHVRSMRLWKESELRGSLKTEVTHGEASSDIVLPIPFETPRSIPFR